MSGRRSIMSAVRSVALVAALLGSASCGEDDGFSPMGERLRLSAARERWIDRGPATYAYSVRINCFCIERPDVRVTVVNGVVTSVRRVGSLEEMPAESRDYFGPMLALFGLVADGLERHPYWMRATYDPSTGFPVDVFFDFERRYADEEWGFSVLDFTEG